MVPTIEEIEDYLQSVEELFYSSIYSATPDLPNLREAVHRLWVDVSRYGPPGLPKSFPEIPNLGVFEVPPPPPPVVPKSWMEKSTDWVRGHPWTTSGIVVGVVGAGLLAGYSVYRMRDARVRRIKAVSKERRQVVVILGGDMPFGSPLIADLERKGYIVITSVSTPEAVDAIERECHGYVRALVLDPNEPGTIPIFLRSLTSTLSRRFPTTASGDPYASPSTYPYIHSVISLLTLPTAIVPAPLEHISLRNSYLPYLNVTHITPLQVLQALLPLLRTTPARSRDQYNGKTIIICLPAIDTRVGLPFASVQAMSAAATLRGIEVMRREINAAAVTDKSESMKNIKVVIVDVGAVNANGSTGQTHSLPPHDVYKAMEDWTASEKLTYGPAFASISREAPSPPLGCSWRTLSSIFSDRFQFGVRRKPTEVGVLVDTLVGVVSGGRYGVSVFGIPFGFGRMRNWIRGERFSVGAGATTYRLASHLPSFILDTLLNIPHFLVSVRNALLPIPLAIVPPLPPTPAAPAAPIDPARHTSRAAGEQEVGNDNDTASEEADVESNSGESESWVSLKKRQERGDA